MKQKKKKSLNTNLLCDFDNFQVYSGADYNSEQVFETQATERETGKKKSKKWIDNFFAKQVYK